MDSMGQEFGCNMYHSDLGSDSHQQKKTSHAYELEDGAVAR